MMKHKKIQYNMRDYSAPAYRLPVYYVGTPAHRMFQHNMQDNGSPAYKLSAYYVGTPVQYEIPLHYVGSSYVKKN